jgi:hypothetical protein
MNEYLRKISKKHCFSYESKLMVIFVADTSKTNIDMEITVLNMWN